MTDKRPALHLVKARKHNELYQRLERAIRTIGWCDGVEDLYRSAIDELSCISLQFDYLTIKEAFTEANNPISLTELHFLAEAQCCGCEQDLRGYFDEAVREDRTQDAIDILVSMAYIESNFAFRQIESIAQGEHSITIGSFSYSFEELQEVDNVRAKELFLRFRHDDTNDV